MKKIYGVDLSKKVTALMVRDAMVTCFFEAHCADTGLGEDGDQTYSKKYCENLIQKAFDEVKGDFDNPSKEDILEVLKKLAVFAQDFRDPSIIEKHQDEMMMLVEKIED